MGKKISVEDRTIAREFRQICLIAQEHLTASIKKASDPATLLNYLTMQIDDLRSYPERMILAKDAALKAILKAQRFYFRVTKGTALVACNSAIEMLNQIEELSFEEIGEDAMHARFMQIKRLHKILNRAISFLPEEKKHAVRKRVPEIPKAYEGLSTDSAKSKLEA